MEKNSAPRLPFFTLPKSRWPSEMGVSVARSKGSSSRRCGVSACVSTTMAEAWMLAGSAFFFVFLDLGEVWAMVSGTNIGGTKSKAVKSIRSLRIEVLGFVRPCARAPRMTPVWILAGEEIFEGLAEDGASDVGDGLGERDILRADLHA